MMHGEHHGNQYFHLAIMAVLSFIAMYILMYAMVDSFANVYSNLNQVYMAALMAAPTVVIELAVMRSMYENRTANIAFIAFSIVIFAASFVAIRQQAVIGDTQFLRSMIPHHASAILMCGKAPVQDAEIKRLCQSIMKGQQAEIDQMKARLSALQGR
jgi:uncharacterized protein (DUF305 family)